MTQRLTLVADASVVARRGAALPDALTMRAMTEADAEALAQLYLSVYHPDVGARSLLEAREEMRLTFAGDFGPLWLDASPVIVDADGVVRAAVMTVTDAPLEWEAPAGPYVIEVLTARLWRGRGLARILLAQTARAVVAAGRETVTLRVDPDNVGALRLYGSVGFIGLGSQAADALDRARNADVGDWRVAVAPTTP
ncbi:MAG: GNAT family N-acetyltransferase [Demequinaceae bacterium]|nr:GNAT family N-acetyltransferase [Demequinaceae bacterium]